MTQNRNAASAYNTASQTVSSLRAVVMLYDGMIKSVFAARTAIEEGRIEDRFNDTQKACKILLGLQANLDFDQGGDMAVMLDRFYHTIFRDLQRINMQNSVALCDSVIAALKEVRQSWNRLAEEGDHGKARVGSLGPSPQNHATEGTAEKRAEPQAPAPGGVLLSI